MKPPAWVPPAVVAETKAMLNGECRHLIQLPEAAPSVIRLATDPRMEKVWRKLKKQSVRIPRAELIESHRVWHMPDSGLAPGLSDSDLALTRIFNEAVLFASSRMKCRLDSEFDGAAESYRRLAKQLRYIAAELFRLHNFYPLALGDFAYKSDQTIQPMAAECELRAATIETTVRTDFKSAGLLAERDHGNLAERAFCVLLTQVMVRLYGKKFEPTVAAIASVALNRTGDLRRVSKWTPKLRK
jgi:hypothetical protein